MRAPTRLTRSTRGRRESATLTLDRSLGGEQFGNADAERGCNTREHRKGRIRVC